MNTPEPYDRLGIAGFSDVLVEVFFIINYSKKVVNAHFGKNSIMHEYMCQDYSFEDLNVNETISDGKLLMEHILLKVEERLQLTNLFNIQTNNENYLSE